MSKTTFTFPSTQTDFIRWLRHYVEPTLGLSFQTQHGSIQLTTITISPQMDVEPAVSIDGIETIKMTPATLLAKTLSPNVVTHSQDVSEYYDGDDRQFRSGLITFCLKAKGKYLEVVMLSDMPALVPYYVNLMAVLYNQWWQSDDSLEEAASIPLATPTTPKPVATSSQRPTGRPTNAEDEWAWCEVRLHGRSPKDVYAEWLGRIGQRAKQLADPQDSFRKAIKPNRLAGKYGRK